MAGFGHAKVKRNTAYKPLFVWFGGKSPVANVIWRALGDVPNYVEPFFGSGATLMLRPGGAGKVETVNDADGLLCNTFRAIQKDPHAVADHALWPISEADLHARHIWLVGQRESITDRLMGDPDFYDAKAAGWWLWGINQWIGSGWCNGKGRWTSRGGLIVPEGGGVKRQRPHLGTTGQGTLRHVGHLETGPGAIEARREWLRVFIRHFADRMQRVRVCCGDWSRVCTKSVTTVHGLTALVLDPPYANTAKRDKRLYSKDSQSVAHDVREWAIEHGDNPKMRIVLCGYEGEHEMPSSWRVFSWETHGGYGVSQLEEKRGRTNKNRERLWFSPHCLEEEAALYVPAESDLHR